MVCGSRRRRCWRSLRLLGLVEIVTALGRVAGGGRFTALRVSRPVMPKTRYCDLMRVRHLRVRIADPRQVTRSRLHVQVFEQAVIAVLHFYLRDLAFRILNVAENNR